MTTPDVHTLTGAYAAGALPEDERQAFDEHLEQCPACRQEVAELTATTARLAVGAATPAPASLREGVLAQVRETRQDPPGDASSPVVLTARALPWYRQPLAAAAAILVVVALGLGAVAIQAERRAGDAEREAARITAMLTDPDRVVQSRPVAGGGRATVLAASGDALFSAQDLEPLPEGRAYQLWVIGADDVRSAGVLGRSESGALERFVTGVRPGDSLGLTVEPAAGSDQPTTEPVWVAPAAA